MVTMSIYESESCKATLVAAFEQKYGAVNESFKVRVQVFCAKALKKNTEEDAKFFMKFNIK